MMQQPRHGARPLMMMLIMFGSVTHNSSPFFFAFTTCLNMDIAKATFSLSPCFSVSSDLFLVFFNSASNVSRGLLDHASKNSILWLAILPALEVALHRALFSSENFQNLHPENEHITAFDFFARAAITVTEF